jgi:hypothetical protein
VDGTERKAAAWQDAVDRGDAERQDAMPGRPLDLPDALAKRAKADCGEHAFGNTGYRPMFSFCSHFRRLSILGAFPLRCVHAE